MGLGVGFIGLGGWPPGPFYTARIPTILKQRARDEGRSLEEVIRREEAALPVGRFGKPEALPEMLAALVSDQARLLAGTVITIEGGARSRV